MSLAYTYLVQCVLVLCWGLAVVLWDPYADWSTTGLFMWNVGVNDGLEQGIAFSCALFWNEFAFLVEGLDMVLLVRQKYAWGE